MLCCCCYLRQHSFECTEESAYIKWSIYCEKQGGFYGKSFKRLFSSM